MKKIICAFSLLGCAAYVQAQTTKPKPKPAGTTASTTAPVLKTQIDSVSYAVAMSTAMFFKEKGVKQLNTAMIQRAFDDVMKKDKTILTTEQMQQCVVSYITKLSQENIAVNKKNGAAFLAANKAKAGVVTLPSGLQYQVVKAGTGTKPGKDDNVKVHYHGTLIDGTVFDSSVDRGEPITLNVSRVIPGWTEALQLMPVGSKWRLFIPSDLAYGDRDGQVIKGGSTLIFDVDLISIEPKDEVKP
ncbi:MAG: FKBP-type peptidyl-prolyl cis-trans isomerase [Filimonas sp.]|nr:FKBP-type peptidyl-prolyl cis-trans isomerase [Filimonas sp.]